MISLEQKTNDFERSNAASARALANDASLSIETLESTVAAQLGLTTPEGIASPKQTAKTIARGMGDAMALVAAHHDPQIHTSHVPRGDIAHALFNEMERARCEACSAGKYSGVDNNLSLLWQHSQTSTGVYAEQNIKQLKLVFSHLTREVLNLKTSPNERLQKVIASWRNDIQAESATQWSLLSQSVSDQSEFAQLSLAIIKSIETSGLNPGDAKQLSTDTGKPDDDASPEKNDTTEPDDAAETEQADDDQDADGSITVELREDSDQPTESVVADTEDADTEEAMMANRDAPVSADADKASGNGQLAGRGYTVYSTAEDEVVTARNLCSADDLTELRTALDGQIKRHAKVVGRLSGRLQRVLMSQQQRHWKFDLEEGVLDTTRLTRVVTEPLSALSFKAESDIEFKNTTVTLLVDNSKSMLGKPIAIAAACADLLSQTLERCGVTVEILGFTTTQLHGGEIFDQWKKNGSSADPGRLNGLRHIIYKSADTPYRSARKNFGLMLMKDLLKQNIDGESLLWAHERLQRRPEQRKILMVISDGAPIDTSTMTANSQNFLSDHLHQVIGSIEKRGAVELLAIGIGHDVSQYYQRAMKIMDARDLSKSMLAHLTDLFSQAN